MKPNPTPELEEVARPAGADVAAAIVAMLIGLSGVKCLDVWFHLRTGQIIHATRSIPSVDSLSHTRAGMPWVTHEWGFELPLYWLWEGTGDAGLVGLKAALAALTALFLVRAALWAGARPAAAGLTMAAAIAVASTRVMVRPHMASAVLTALVMLYGYRHLRTGRQAWPIVAIALLWANMHSGVVVGLGVVGAFALEALWRRRDWHMAKVGVAATLAVLANPHGWKVFWYPFWLVWANDQGYFQIVELSTPEFPESVHAWAAVALGLGLIAGRRAGLATWIIALAGGVIGLTRVRGALDLTLMTAPMIAVGLTRVAQLLRLSAPSWAAPTVPIAAGAGLLAATGWAPDFEIDPWAVPSDAMDFVTEADLQGQMLNSHAFGAWLTWAHPDRKVYTDGRNEVYIDLFVETRETPLATLADRYDLGYAVIEYPRTDDKHEVQLSVDITDGINADPNWALMYFDDVARVYARRTSANAAVISARGYERLRPGWTDLDYIGWYVGSPAEAAAFEDEARRAVAAAPDARVPRMHLAEFLRLAGRNAEALEQLEGADDDVFGLGRRAAIYLQMGRSGEAIEPLVQAIELEPDNATLWSNLGLARVRIGDYPGAIVALREAVALDPRLLPAIQNLSLALRRSGDTAAADTVTQQGEAVALALATESFTAAQELLRRGYPDRAVAELQQAERLHPGIANTSYLLGVSFNMLGDGASAETSLKRCLQIQPTHPYAPLELADALANQCRLTDARDALLAYIAAGPPPQWQDKARARIAALDQRTDCAP